MIKIVTIVGARPQFVKAAVVSRSISARSTEITEVLIHTGQHYDPNMSDVFFDEMGIQRPAHNLGIGGGSHAQNTGQMLEKIEGLLIDEKPDWVLVYGDTDSTLAGALAAAKIHIPVAHVEAGLRSFNRMMPEETNRVLTDHMASLLLVPTNTARSNLANEGIVGDKVLITGDVMYDAALHYAKRARKPSWFDEQGVGNDGFALCTIHRAENTDDGSRLRQIFRGLGKSSRIIILPLHPRTRGHLDSHGIEIPVNVRLVDPVGYLEMVWLEMNCDVVATDSGGVQKEAYFHQKPCLTMRDETEWLELVEAGCNRLVGTDPDQICDALDNFGLCSFDRPLYGDGNSADRIVSEIVAHSTQY